MILEGNERGFGAELARHLLNLRDNDHVAVHALDGFVASDLAGAFAECEAIAQGTQCRKYLFSLSLNPPPTAKVTVEQFEDAIARIEVKLGLAGQARAVIFHEKNGRRHAHCVWSRIDARRMRAINLAHTKRKLMDISIALYRDHGWSMPEGFLDHARRDPLNHSRAEAGQAKRTGHDPKAIKALFKRCWEQSDSRAGFAAALWAEGYCLAQGERRAFVAVDGDGKVWSLSRWCGRKTKELSARLGDPDDLPSLEEARKLFEGLADKERASGNSQTARRSFEEKRRQLVESQRRERDALIAAQEHCFATESLAREARLPRGLRAAWARLNGSYERLLGELAREAAACAARDREERQALIDRHLADRKAFERREKAPDISRALDEILVAAGRPDARQRLVLQEDDALFSRQQLAAHPDLILRHLSHKKASFRELDVKRALADYIDNPLVLRSAIDSALASPELVRLESGDLTTRDYLGAEQNLHEAAGAMAAPGGFAVASRHVFRAMQDQDAQLQSRFGSCLSDEQRTALWHVLGGGQFACVVGLAGSGKSTMLKTARDAWERQGIRVHGAALSGKAAEGLRSASGIESRTLASLETSWKNGYEPIARGEVLVVDEVGMVGTRQMTRVAARLQQIGAKLVLIGDPGQLQPIEAGTPFADLIARHGAATLSEIHRQKEAWQRHASRDLAEGRLKDAVHAYENDGSVRRTTDQENAVAALMEDYLKDRNAGAAPAAQLAFAHRRKDVFALNQAIRNAVRPFGGIKSELLFSTETGPRAFAAGDRVVFTRNDRDLGVKNGMLGTVESIDADRIAVRLDDDGGGSQRVAFNPVRYRHFDHGYAVTIHKSQGATIDRSYVLASRGMDEPLTYVAMTRHRDALRLYISDDDSPAWAAPENKRQQEPPRRRRTFDHS